jgi:hypothetical protein
VEKYMVNLHGHLKRLHRSVKNDRAARVIARDFDLYMSVLKAQNTLGPAQVTKVLPEAGEVLITKKVQMMHAARLEFYADSNLHVTEACEVQLHGLPSSLHRRSASQPESRSLGKC